MGRTLTFYVGIILLLGTAGFFIAMFTLPPDWEIKDGWFAGWTTIVAVTGFFILLYTPIQWLAYWLKRPWLAYMGSLLLFPAFFLIEHFSNIREMEFSLDYIWHLMQRDWGMSLAAILIGVFFTWAYQGWYRKKT